MISGINSNNIPTPAGVSGKEQLSSYGAELKTLDNCSDTFDQKLGQDGDPRPGFVKLQDLRGYTFQAILPGDESSPQLFQRQELPLLASSAPAVSLEKELVNQDGSYDRISVTRYPSTHFAPGCQGGFIHVQGGTVEKCELKGDRAEGVYARLSLDFDNEWRLGSAASTGQNLFFDDVAPAGSVASQPAHKAPTDCTTQNLPQFECAWVDSIGVGYDKDGFDRNGRDRFGNDRYGG